ncbi:MAG: outer membrane beta-barrel protein [Cyclobacteriaceae bacterium]|nr:outer membrane beta-barrel protein [Cyclobacteriaceae bacterium]
MVRFVLVLLAISGSLIAVAQNGSISGKVTDAATGEAIVGANAIIQGTTVGASTDLDGHFTIGNLKPGTYTVAISFVTYKTHIIADVVVEPGKITSVQVPLSEDATELQEVVVTSTRQINTDHSLVAAIKESKLVVSGISAEQIVKLPDSDAAQIAQRVPGITIVDNRFVMVRGVPERYNQVMINGAIAPSTEIDRRSFSFDLIPSSSIDQMLIYKSGSPEMPGDFAGGVIRMITKETSSEEYTSFGFSTGYRVGTTFNSFNKSQSSATDFLGFDNGMRSLPAGFPSSEAMRESATRSSLRSDAGKSLLNTMNYSTIEAPMDFGLNFGLARNLQFGSFKASNVTALSYSRSFQNYDMSFIRYNEVRTQPNQEPVIQFDFNDNYSKSESKINLVHNWLFDLGARAKVRFKNLAVQIGEDQAMLRSGFNNYEQVGKLQNNNAYRYLSRFIYAGQLEGTFKSANEATIYSVAFGANYINRNEPDYRRFRRVKVADSNDPFELILPPSSSPIDAGRFYSELEDKGFSNGFNVEHKFGSVKAERSASVKAGYYLEKKDRHFSARYISYFYPGINGFPAEVGQDIIHQSLDRLFSPENMFTYNQDGSVIPGMAVIEGTRPTDRYKGENFYSAGYVSGSLPVGKFDLSGGIRVENNVQKLTTQNDAGPIAVNNPILSPLPFVNLAFNVTNRALIRTAYSRTINRPEFRELAPFGYYQFELDANTFGNPNLKTATIDNIDLRFEMYPNPGETFSIGTFYKKFTDPIEFSLTNTGGLGQNFSYINAPQAYSYGAELELKKSLASLAVNRFFRNTSVNINASIIKSEVDLGAAASGFQSRTRPLQGQSPYVVNGNLYYSDPATGWSVNIGYNVFGKRIMAVGSIILPTWWEMPRNVIDMQVAKSFNKLEVKLNINNLLNARYRIMQDDNLDSKIDNNIDQFVRGYRTGQLATLSVGWKFMKD